jgi:hypothetical protein
MNRRPSALDHRRDARTAKSLGVTPTGLRVLAKMVTDPNGHWKGGLSSGNPGSSKVRLERDGFITGCAWGDWAITDAGRDVVRRARAMGW